MKFFKYLLSGENISTLIAVSITGLIIHGLTDLGFWACAFFGYFGVEATSASNRVETAQLDITRLYSRHDESQQQIELLWEKLSDIKDKVEDAGMSRIE